MSTEDNSQRPVSRMAVVLGRLLEVDPRLCDVYVQTNDPSVLTAQRMAMVANATAVDEHTEGMSQICDIIRAIVEGNLLFPPKSAVSAYHWSLECAQKWRIAAGIAARIGERDMAITFVARAQANDDAARDWKAQIPEWQEAAYYCGS